MGRLAKFWEWVRGFGRPRPPSVVATSTASPPIIPAHTTQQPSIGRNRNELTPAVLAPASTTIPTSTSKLTSTILPRNVPTPTPLPAPGSASLSALTQTSPPLESICLTPPIPTALSPPTDALTDAPETQAADTRDPFLWEQALEKLRKKGLKEFEFGDGNKLTQDLVANDQKAGDQGAEDGKMEDGKAGDQKAKDQGAEDGKTEDGKADHGVQLVRDLIAKVKDIKAECDTNRVSYNNSRGEKVFYLEKLTTKLHKFAYIGDIAIQQNPEVVALAWAGFRLLLEVGIAYTDNMGMISDSLEYLVSVIYCGEIYQTLYSRTRLAMAEPLNRYLVDLYALILEYLWRAARFLQKRTAIRITESFSSKLKRTLESIQKLEQVIRDSADLAEKEATSESRSKQKKLRQSLAEMQGSILDIRRAVMESYRKIEAMWQYVEKNQRLEVLRWISDVEFGSHHSEFKNRRHSDTGTWLLENPKFNDWEMSSSSRIFWLRGDAGSGKTMLASKIIDVLRDKARANYHALAYFYCYFQELARSDPKLVLRAIVKQLCVAYSEEGLPEPVMSIYKARERWGHSTGPLDLIESRNLIIELSGKFSHTTIVIDALDECNQTTRGEMFRILKEIVESGNGLQIFVTSRNEGDIREMLLSMPNHYIDASDNSEDIKKYIRTEVTRLCDERPLLGVDQVLKSEIILALENGAKGMFLWAHLQILAIRNENTPGDIRTALQNLPRDLNATYFDILQRIRKQSNTSYNRAIKVLKWVLCAQGVCSPETIRQALLFDSMTLLDQDQLMQLPHILDICRNLVIYDKKLEVLRFAHFSVEEFLRVQPEYSPETIHTSIAEICLTVLCPNPNLETQVSRVPDLLNYAVLNWAVHVGLSSAGSDTLQQLWKKFLQPSSVHYRAWATRVIKIRGGPGNTLEAKGENTICPLWVACYYQLYAIFESLLNDKTIPDSYNIHGQTPLIHASKHKYKIFVKRLLEEEGVNVNSKDVHGRASLSWAAENGHEKVVRILLRKEGVDVNSKDATGRTPVFLAAEGGHERVVRILLEKEGVDVNIKDTSGQTLLSWAARNGHEWLVQILMKKEELDVNSKDMRGRTPISWAARNGHEWLVQILMKKEELDVDSRDESSRTPLSWAAERGHEMIVQILLAKEGVDFSIKDITGRKPLFRAADKGHEKVVRILLAKEGVDVNSKCTFSQIPISWATENIYERLVWILLDKGRVDVNNKDESGQTLLSWAAGNGHERVVRILLEKWGVDVNSKDMVGRTPLSWAAGKGHGKLVQILLAKEGIDLNNKDVYGRTPLFWAADKGHERVVQVLLEKEGVDVNSEDIYSRTPLSCSREKGHIKVVEMLREAA